MRKELLEKMLSNNMTTVVNLADLMQVEKDFRRIELSCKEALLNWVKKKNYKDGTFDFEVIIEMEDSFKEQLLQEGLNGYKTHFPVGHVAIPDQERFEVHKAHESIHERKPMKYIICLDF